MIRRWLIAVAEYLRTPPSALPREIGASVTEEIKFHLHEAVQEQVEDGVPEAAAHRAASARFGDAGKVAADCYSLAVADQILCHRVHLLLTAVLAIALGAYWAAQRPAGAGVADRMEAATAGTLAEEHDAWTGDISGQVVNERAEPIRGAHVLAVVKTWPPNGYRQQAYMTTSGPDGRFTIADVYPVGRQYEVQIATVADRRTLQSSYFSSEGESLEPVVFRLEPTPPLELRIEGADGMTVEGAEVVPHRRLDSRGQDHLVYFQSADPIIQRTNEAGIVRLTCYRPGDRAAIYIRLPNREWQTREITVPPSGRTVVLKMNQRKDGGTS